MLAQSFKSATDLGITEVEVQSLIKVLGMLERGEIATYDFGKHEMISMGRWITQAADDECGTVACICGWAYTISKGRAFPEVTLGGIKTTKALMCRIDKPTSRLFGIQQLLPEVTAPQAAMALRSYLTTGEARWDLALADRA